MRCIDADALRDRLQSLGYDDWNQGVSTSWADAYLECADMVDEQPTIEPERKKGEWMPIIESNENGEAYQSGIYCNNCGYTSVCEDNYCPNCGARMI